MQRMTYLLLRCSLLISYNVPQGKGHELNRFAVNLEYVILLVLPTAAT